MNGKNSRITIHDSDGQKWIKLDGIGFNGKIGGFCIYWTPLSLLLTHQLHIVPAVMKSLHARCCRVCCWQSNKSSARSQTGRSDPASFAASDRQHRPNLLSLLHRVRNPRRPGPSLHSIHFIRYETRPNAISLISSWAWLIVILCVTGGKKIVLWATTRYYSWLTPIQSMAMHQLCPLARSPQHKQ